jgi:hypothetical protein
MSGAALAGVKRAKDVVVRRSWVASTIRHEVVQGSAVSASTTCYVLAVRIECVRPDLDV